jgi:hypothetical protein
VRVPAQHEQAYPQIVLKSGPVEEEDNEIGVDGYSVRTDRSSELRGKNEKGCDIG